MYKNHYPVIVRFDAHGSCFAHPKLEVVLRRAAAERQGLNFINSLQQFCGLKFNQIRGIMITSDQENTKIRVHQDDEQTLNLLKSLHKLANHQDSEITSLPVLGDRRLDNQIQVLEDLIKDLSPPSPSLQT